MNEGDLMRMELIGLNVEVLSMPYSGISGMIVDETRNTFTILSAGTERMVPKQGNRFSITGPGPSAILDGSVIRHRPEDRIKKIK